MGEPMDGVIDYMASQAAESDKERILALKNVGPLHHVCKGAPITPRFHASQNLIELFRLSATADSVRRVDPQTGEKINKLRKSYEGKVKELRLPGRNKAVSSPGEWLPRLLNIPAEDWINTHVRGKMPENITASPEWAIKLKRAFQMQPGKLSAEREAYYRNIINLNDPLSAQVKSMRPPLTSNATTTEPLQQLQRPGLPHSNTLPASSSKLDRPERKNSKRTYMDSSFVGYGDGYVDDDDVENPEDGSIDTKASRLKKRRKDGYSATATSISAATAKNTSAPTTSASASSSATVVLNAPL